MFKQLGIAFFISISMGTVATAQTTPKVDTQSETSKTQPKEKSKEKSKEKAKPKDLDAFFKDAEEQMKDGPSCQPPPDPIV